MTTKRFFNNNIFVIVYGLAARCLLTQVNVAHSIGSTHFTNNTTNVEQFNPQGLTWGTS